MKTWFLIALSIFAGLPAFASGGGAGSAGNGGGAIVCIGSDGKITSAKLLDLWEGEQDEFRPLRIPRSNEEQKTQLNRALDKFSKTDPSTVASMRSLMADRLHWKKVPLPADYQLPPPWDTGLTLLKRTPGCSLQTAASYEDYHNRLVFDPWILGAMGPTDLAALDFHEALYWVQRNQGRNASVSTSARHLTAAAFSSAPLALIDPRQGVEKAQFECDAGGMDHFFIFQRPYDWATLQFTKIEGIDLLDLTLAHYSPPRKPCSLIGDQAPVTCDPQPERLYNGLQPHLEQNRYGNPDSSPRPADLTTDSWFEPSYHIVIHAIDRWIDLCQAGSPCDPDLSKRFQVRVNDKITLTEIPGSDPSIERSMVCKRL